MKTFTKSEIVLNGICPYYTMFPLSFPLEILKKARRKQWVLDPFCGRGTTNFAARLYGISSIGIDSNNMAAAIAEAKLCHSNAASIKKLSVEILNSKSIASNIPEGEFWYWAFAQNTLNEICIYREYFLNKEKLDDTDKLLRALILGILHGPILKTVKNYLSNQMPKTYSTKPDYSIRYWKKNNLKPFYVNSIEIIQRKGEHFFKSLPNYVEGKIINGDSRTIKLDDLGKRFDWIITSPPYYGMDSYEQDQWLRNWFLGGSETVIYSRRNQIKHHSEDAFIDELRSVWINTSYVCNEKAKLVIRFGAIPSKLRRSPEEILISSIENSSSQWKINKICTAGEPVYYRRQANQFKRNTGKYIEEFDLIATLNH